MANEAKLPDHLLAIPDNPAEAYALGFERGKQDAFYYICEWSRDDACGAVSHIYFIGDGTGPIKIGKANNPAARLASIQTGHPTKLKLLAVREGCLDDERAYHSRFAGHRLHGEWFSPSPEILAEIDRLSTAPNARIGGGAV